MRILVVEDEGRLAENIAGAMREGPGYAVDVAPDGEEALLFCAGQHYDLILLDLMIPEISGMQVLRQLRRQGDATPILILTAINDSRTTIELLNLGADDYLTKPFDLGELIARARALIRRSKGAIQSALSFGTLVLKTTEQTVTVQDEIIDLSPTEYRILEYLMHRPKVVVPKRELLEHLFDFTWQHHSNVIEAHVSNLRKKLRTVESAPTVEAYRGRGYRLSVPEISS